MGYKIEQPTVGIRFVERDGKRILQYRVRVEWPQEGRGEMQWQDVPLETE